MKFNSQLIAGASGSVGGATFSRNKGGQYIRKRAIPTNPNSPAQQEVRSALSMLSQHWSDLTDAQRDGWAYYAANVSVINTLGAAIFLSGQQMYIRSNTPREYVGLALVDNAPTNFTLGMLTLPSVVTDNAGNADVSFTNTDEWATAAGGALLVYCSKPLQPTINYFKGPFLYIGMIEGAGTAPTSPESMTIGVFPVGTKLFFAFRATSADGRLSNQIILPNVIEA